MNTAVLILTILSYTVTDGDTIKSNDVGIRIWGMDAPEMSESAGPVSKQALKQLSSGQALTCNVKDTDRYNRIVAQCFLPDGRDLACELIKAGQAEEWLFFSKGAYRDCGG